ncbi:hypothetical protein AVEN_249284-1 [Araneus ventricosus]|uniref:G patch domain-containing protein 1 n=1 Tax=Araneus ventricosus TaxID=182803 RepID=A0A4Y2K5G6_ARAVE|nr:hypothetical protein AVEN_249284-1 [Araneus ventricosus]
MKSQHESTKKAKDKRKLVGMHNRKTSEWHPASLLCKRFNVPNPFPNSSEVSGSQKSKSLFDHISFESREIEQDSQPSNSSSKIKAVEETFPVHNEKYADKLPENSLSVSANKNENIQPSETGRPPIDFFKDIFENSSSDEEDSPSAETENPKTPAETEIAEEEKTSSITTSEAVVPSNKTTENKKVGFGVFANLDLDALNQKTPKLRTERRESSESKCEVMDTSENLPNENGATGDKASITVENSTLSSDLYGPELPPNFSESSYSTPPKFESKKKAKHKVKHKRKHHKHKNKKKKKKHSSHKSSEDSSFDSDEDIPPTVILEKFKKLQKVLK